MRPASRHYQQKKQFLVEFKKDETEPHVKLWIDEYVADLDQHIADARIREEREDS